MRAVCWIMGHAWGDRERFYAPPHDGTFLAPPELKSLEAAGFTTVIERCRRCGDVRTRRYHGTTQGVTPDLRVIGIKR